MYYLKNKYTEIPNEFGIYDSNNLKGLFDGICASISECIPIEYASSFSDDFQVRVYYEDNSSQAFKEQEENEGDSVSKEARHIAHISEFFSNTDSFWHPEELLIINDLRCICKVGKISPDELLKNIKHTDEDGDGSEVRSNYSCFYRVVYGQRMA